MADEVQRLEEDNASLRDQIEEVQQRRRAGFGDAEEIARALTAYEENERLKQVLKSQEEILAREEQIRENMLNDEKPLTVDGIPLDTPYTITPDGPRVSDPVVVDDSTTEGEPEAPQVNEDRPARLAELAAAVTSGSDDETNENEEN